MYRPIQDEHGRGLSDELSNEAYRPIQNANGGGSAVTNATSRGMKYKVSYRRRIQGRVGEVDALRHSGSSTWDNCWQ